MERRGCEQEREAGQVARAGSQSLSQGVGALTQDVEQEDGSHRQQVAPGERCQSHARAREHPIPGAGGSGGPEEGVQGEEQEQDPQRFLAEYALVEVEDARGEIEDGGECRDTQAAESHAKPHHQPGGDQAQEDLKGAGRPGTGAHHGVEEREEVGIQGVLVEGLVGDESSREDPQRFLVIGARIHGQARKIGVALYAPKVEEPHERGGQQGKAHERPESSSLRRPLHAPPRLILSAAGPVA